MFIKTHCETTINIRRNYDETTMKLRWNYDETTTKLRRNYDKTTTNHRSFVVVSIVVSWKFPWNYDETTKLDFCSCVVFVCCYMFSVGYWAHYELALVKIPLMFGYVLLCNAQAAYKTCASPHLHVLKHMSSLLILIAVSRLLFNMYGVRLPCGASGNCVTSVQTRRYTM